MREFDSNGSVGKTGAVGPDSPGQRPAGAWTVARAQMIWYEETARAEAPGLAVSALPSTCGPTIISRGPRAESLSSREDPRRRVVWCQAFPSRTLARISQDSVGRPRRSGPSDRLGSEIGPVTRRFAELSGAVGSHRSQLAGTGYSWVICDMTTRALPSVPLTPWPATNTFAKCSMTTSKFL